MVIVRVVLPWMANSVAIRRSRILKGVQFGYNALDAKKKQFAMRMFLRYSMDALVAFAVSKETVLEASLNRDDMEKRRLEAVQDLLTSDDRRKYIFILVIFAV